MGLIAKIKELFSAKQYILRAMEEQDAQYKRYAELSPAGLSELADGELYSAVLYRMDTALRARDDLPKKAGPAERAARLNDPGRAVYVASELDSEMAEGGLSAFFLDDTRTLALQVSDSLREIGAQEHRALFDAFVLDHQVDLTRPRAFAQDPDNDQAFETFDRAYQDLPPLEGMVVSYIRRHITEF